MLTSNCPYIPSKVFHGQDSGRCSGWGAQCDTDLSLQWSGVARAALGSSVMLRAKAGTKQGWQCMFFPTQCPGSLPLLMNTLSSSCSELIFLWVLCTFQFFCCSCASSSVGFYSQDLCFCYFLLLSEPSSVFFQSSSIPVHLFITVYVSLGGFCLWLLEMRSTSAPWNMHQLISAE